MWKMFIFMNRRRLCIGSAEAKMSGGNRSGPPKHQNKYAWKPNAGRKINETVCDSNHFFNLTLFLSNQWSQKQHLNTIINVITVCIHRKLEEGSDPSLRSLGCVPVARNKSSGNVVMESTSLFFNLLNGTIIYLLFFIFLYPFFEKNGSWITLDCYLLAFGWLVSLLGCSQRCSKRNVRQAYHNLCSG